MWLYSFWNKGNRTITVNHVILWFCCKSKCEHMDWFGINWQGDHWVHYMDHIPIMVQKTFNCPYFVAYFPIILYFYMPLRILQSIISSPLLLSLCNKALLLRAVLKRVPTFEGTFLTLWVPIYFPCHKQWLWKGPQLRTWSSWGPNCWNGPHLVLILHKRPHLPQIWYIMGFESVFLYHKWRNIEISNSILLYMRLLGNGMYV